MEMEKPKVEKVVKTNKIRSVIDKNGKYKIYSGLIAFLSIFNIIWFFVPIFNVTYYHKISVFDLFMGMIGQKSNGTIEYFLINRTEIKPITILIIVMSILLIIFSAYLIIMNLITVVKKKYKFENNQVVSCCTMISGLIILLAVIYSTVIWQTKRLSDINDLLIMWSVIAMTIVNTGIFVMSLLIQKNEMLDEEEKKNVKVEH